jgi:Tannase and feruloyl esterase
MRINPIVLGGALMCATTAFGQGGGQVQFRDWNVPSASAKPKVSCGSLRALTNYEISIVGAKTIAASDGVPEHCRVSLMIQPALNIEVNLPAAWNGRFYMFGNGGFAGESFEASARVISRARALKAGFAVAATDTGHSSAKEPGGSFARNRQELLDFGFRSLHLTAETGKMLVRAYYGEGPSKSYYDGCSQGGREGLIFAQRFPTDFDGILAGAPALNYTGAMLARAYWMQALTASPIPVTKLKLLADMVYAKCDAEDGLKDGLISDPRGCDFSASKDLPRCEEGADGANCFRPAEIGAIELVYSDVMSQGKRLFPGWPVGAESAVNGQSAWVGQVVNFADGRPGAWRSYADGFLEYFGFSEKDPASTVAGFNIDRDPQRVAEIRGIMDATDPDLSGFREHKGKLLMYFGWADPQLNPRMGVEYYESVVAQMGSSTSDFVRLFMVPGMFHCGGGVGTSTFDAMTPLIQWVELSKPPTELAASRVVEGKVVRTRPVCAYPEVARYKGSGSIDEAGNFACVRP